MFWASKEIWDCHCFLREILRIVKMTHLEFILLHEYRCLLLKTMSQNVSQNESKLQSLNQDQRLHNTQLKEKDAELVYYVTK